MDLPSVDTSLLIAIGSQIFGSIWWASKITSEVRALKAQLAAHRSNHETRLNKVESRQDEADKTVTRFESVLARLDERTEKMQTDVEKLADYIMRATRP